MGITPTERKLLDSMETHVSVAEAAKELDLSPQYANVLLYRLRKKIFDWTEDLTEIQARKKRSHLVAKILMERK